MFQDAPPFALLAEYGTVWHSVAPCGTVWHSMAQYGTVWHSMAQVKQTMMPVM